MGVNMHFQAKHAKYYKFDARLKTIPDIMDEASKIKMGHSRHNTKEADTK